MSEYILTAEAVRYRYEDGTCALNGVDLCVRRGEKLAIMGANGSGKSTFFLCLNGVLRPNAGTLLLDGEPYQYSQKGLLSLRRRVGIVFQDPDNQLFSADVYGEISFGALNLGLSENEARRRVEQVLQELNLTQLADKPVHLLSGGQKKLIAIADVLVMQPDVVLLDEPATALDPRHAHLVDDAIDRMSASGITVIISTHDVNRALSWADSVALFDGGQVLKKDTPENIFSESACLSQCNLEPPGVMAVYQSLLNAGLLPQGCPMPRSEKDLIRHVQLFAKSENPAQF